MPEEEAVAPSQSASDSSHPIRLLLVEDDPSVSTAMAHFFTDQGYEVTCAYDGEEALALLEPPPRFDLVTLDVTLPKKSGFEVLKETQQRGLAVPVLMVTARGEQENILKGLGLGASDYVVKPFDADDLLKRIETILGYLNGPETPLSTYRFGDVEIDFERGTATRAGKPLHFSELEIDLLEYLIANKGQVVTRKRLLRDAWGIDADHVAFTVSPEIVTQQLEKHLGSIRRQIEPTPSTPRYLESVYGLGYRFNDE